MVVISYFLQDSAGILYGWTCRVRTVPLLSFDQTTELAVLLRAIHVFVRALIEVFGYIEKFTNQPVVAIRRRARERKDKAAEPHYFDSHSSMNKDVRWSRWWWSRCARCKAIILILY